MADNSKVQVISYTQLDEELNNSAAYPDENTLEMSTLTALLCVAQLSGETGKKLLDETSEETLTDFLTTYSHVKIIF